MKTNQRTSLAEVSIKQLHLIIKKQEAKIDTFISKINSQVILMVISGANCFTYLDCQGPAWS